MFFKLAIGAVGIGVVLMIGYIVIAQARATLPNEVDGNLTESMNNAQATIFAGFGLVAVGIIVLAAFGIINLWK